MSHCEMKTSMLIADSLVVVVIVVLFFVVVASTTAKDHRRRSTKLILHNTCNRTLTPPPITSTDLTIRLSSATTTKYDDNNNDDDDADDDNNNDASLIYCWTRFEGTSNQFIEITVKELRLGPESCLKISDHEHTNASDWLPQPTTLCGRYNDSEGRSRVRRRTWSPSALVEFKNNKVKPEGGFEYDATFVNKEEDSERLPYGHIDRKEGRISNTKCDWLIRVDECVGFCNVISPGHPGIYPPNTRCRYHFENSENLRVELKFGGIHFNGIFDLRESKNCEEDYIEVYDGRSVTHPLIGRFCGRKGAHLISSGPSILMIFQSGNGKNPPWNYTGFSMQTMERWNYHNDPFEGGIRKPNSSCDLIFHSANSFSGDTHTPDYFLTSETNCTYEFHGLEKYRERIELTVSTQQIIHGDQTFCSETLVVYDGDTEMKRFCLDRASGGRTEFTFNTTTTTAFVRYFRTTGQMSNPDPPWISFRFFRLPKSTAIPTAPVRKDGSTMSDFGSELSFDQATEPKDLIVLSIPSDVNLPSDSSASKSNQPDKSVAAAAKTATLTVQSLLLVTYFRRK